MEDSHSDINWEAYFPMPNSRNHERLNYLLDKYVGINQQIDDVIISYKHILKNIPNDLLYNASIHKSSSTVDLTWGYEKVYSNYPYIVYIATANLHESMNLFLWEGKIKEDLNFFSQGKIAEDYDIYSTRQLDILSEIIITKIKEAYHGTS